MKLKLFFTMLMLTAINRSFSVTSAMQQELNNQLQDAISRGNDGDMASLLQAGADINANTTSGMAPLHWIALNGQNARVASLLQAGAHINARDNGGMTPLHWAALNDRTATVEFLLSHGAGINAKNHRDDTPLMLAVLSCHTATVKLLVAYQALLERSKKPTKALLKEAIEHGYYTLVKLLLQHITPDASDLQLAKEKWRTAEYKKLYEAIGQLLIKKLSLLEKVDGTPGGGRISKAGIVGLYGLPETIAQEIAQYQ